MGGFTHSEKIDGQTLQGRRRLAKSSLRKTRESGPDPPDTETEHKTIIIIMIIIKYHWCRKKTNMSTNQNGIQ